MLVQLVKSFFMGRYAGRIVKLCPHIHNDYCNREGRCQVVGFIVNDTCNDICVYKDEIKKVLSYTNEEV
jgi:hypothetical protein